MIDTSGTHSCDGNAKLEVIIVSDKFEKISLLQRHRMVNECVAEYMSQIHALSIKAWTVQQYETKKANS